MWPMGLLFDDSLKIFVIVKILMQKLSDQVDFLKVH